VLLKFLFFIGIIGLSLYFFDKLVRNWLGLKERNRDEKYVNKLHKFGTHFLSFVLSYCFIFIYNDATFEEFFWIFVIFILATFSFNTIMEWIYLKDKRELLASIIVGVFGLLMLKSCLYYGPLLFN
jgi:hypothetical protein